MELSAATPILTTPTMQAFTRLSANVKARIDIDLAPCTAIVGPNKSFKTGILDTVRLALTGKHPIGGHPADLAELLAPSTGDIMRAMLTGPSGIAKFAQDIPGGKGRKPKHELSGALERR